MTAGTGLAILGVWLFAAASWHSSDIYESGKSRAIRVALGMTVAFILVGVVLK